MLQVSSRFGIYINCRKRKSIDNPSNINALWLVGVRRFELPTTRPPDAYSNRAELHPELRVQRYSIFIKYQIFFEYFFVSGQNLRFTVSVLILICFTYIPGKNQKHQKFQIG